jgi:hypothetical protein
MAGAQAHVAAVPEPQVWVGRALGLELVGVGEDSGSRLAASVRGMTTWFLPMAVPASSTSASPAFLFVLIFLISLLSVYPEQLFDKDINLGAGWKKMLWPVDLVRAFAWVLAIALVLRYLSIPPPKKPQFDVLWWLAPLRRRLSTWRLRPNLPEILIVAPVVLLLFWSNLTLNERMWLPIEVITLSQTPEKLRTPPRGTRRGWVVRARSRSTSPRTSTNTESRCIRSSERMGAASRSWGMCCRFRTTGPPS